MKKVRIVAVMLVAALAVTLAGESALGVPPQAQKGFQTAQGKVPAQGQAGLTKADQGAANGGQGLDQAGSVVPTQGQAGLTKAGQGAANGQSSQKGQKGQKGGKGGN